MKKELIELFTKEQTELSYKKIKKYVSRNEGYLDTDLRTLLHDLELEGVLYESSDGLFRSLPSNFFVREITETKKGSYYVSGISEEKLRIDSRYINGALNYDKVLVEIDNGKAKVVKVLERNFPNVVCEVIEIEGVKHLKPLDTNNNLELVIGHNTMKKLVPGERILVEVSRNVFDYNEGKTIYDAKFIKSIGHKNDPDIDYKTVAYNNGFSVDFSPEAIEEANNIPDEVSEEEIEGRMDLRKWNIFTIDGIDCKDMDDAVSIKKTEDGYLLGVHISHVSHYIKPDMALFKEALERTTSVYFPGSVIPMFPHKISDGICSLNEGVDRLTRSVLIEFDNSGNVKDYKIVKSVINSKKKMNYDDVEKVINGETVEGYEPFKEDLMAMKELSEKLTILKKERGYASFDSSELKFKLDELNNTEKIQVKERKISEEIIENFMVTANTIIPKYIGNRPCVYRNHPFPSDGRIRETLATLNDLGYRVKNLSGLKKQVLVQTLLNMFKDKEEFLILSNMILRSVRMAFYGVENEGHFGLALDEGYTHFTSPIRRLADLLEHTLLDLYDEKELCEKEIENILELLKTSCEHASKMERMADKAEYEIDKLQVINYIKQNIGEKHEVFIEQVFPNYIVVRSKDFMDGIIYIEDFNDEVYYISSGKLKSRITGNQYKIGHKLEVEIKDASYFDKTIYYKLLKNLTLEEGKQKKLEKKL